MASEKGEFRKRGEIPKMGENQPRLMPLEIEIYISLFNSAYNANLFPSVNNVGRMAEAIQVPLPSAPDQVNPRQFTQAKSADQVAYM